jgi:hypothetical protein
MIRRHTFGPERAMASPIRKMSVSAGMMRQTGRRTEKLTTFRRATADGVRRICPTLTGASRGIGQAAAQGLLKAGCSVIVNARTSDGVAGPEPVERRGPRRVSATGATKSTRPAAKGPERRRPRQASSAPSSRAVFARASAASDDLSQHWSCIGRLKRRSRRCSLLAPSSGARPETRIVFPKRPIDTSMVKSIPDG